MPNTARMLKSYELNRRLKGFDGVLPQFIGGVYRVRNTSTGDCYIGATNNLRSRRSAHRHLLTYGAHVSLLQAGFNKSGPEAFVFEVLLICAERDQGMYESACIAKFRPAYNWHK